VRYIQSFEGARSSTSAIIVDDKGERLIVGQRDAGMPSGTSWLLPSTHKNVMLVRYEELHQDAVGALKSVLDFSGVTVRKGSLEAAVESSRFEKMRSAEEKFGVNGHDGDKSEHFVRKGRVGGWQEEMGYRELRALEQRYGKVMKQLGYAPLS